MYVFVWVHVCVCAFAWVCEGRKSTLDVIPQQLSILYLCRSLPSAPSWEDPIQGLMLPRQVPYDWGRSPTPTLFFETVSLLGLGFPRRLSWLMSKPKRCSCLHLPRTDITDTHHSAQLFFFGFGDWTQVLVLAWKCFNSKLSPSSWKNMGGSLLNVLLNSVK